mmetsp:Transcript_9873/g.29016  ORF Transcript_9873/g.29016 Transcript_9873/m.29016 type:complete len:222 (+) Transcript_9873:1351-2016(+)
MANGSCASAMPWNAIRISFARALRSIIRSMRSWAELSGIMSGSAPGVAAAPASGSAFDAALPPLGRLECALSPFLADSRAEGRDSASEPPASRDVDAPIDRAEGLAVSAPASDAGPESIIVPNDAALLAEMILQRLTSAGGPSDAEARLQRWLPSVGGPSDGSGLREEDTWLACGISGGSGEGARSGRSSTSASGLCTTWLKPPLLNFSRMARSLLTSRER